MNAVYRNKLQHHKYLGVILSNKGTWREHINYITSKAWQKYVMCKLKFLLSMDSLNKIYITSILKYADIV